MSIKTHENIPKLSLIVLSIITIISLSLLPTISQPTLDLTKTEIDTSTNVIHWTDIKTDSSNYSHIVYEDNETNMVIKYTCWNGTAWNTTTIDTGGNKPSLSLADDEPYISYVHDNGSLMFAYYDSGWINMTLDSTTTITGRPVIVTDSSGNSYIIYYDDTNDIIKCAYVYPGGPSFEIKENITLADNGFPGFCIDGNDKLHILYSNSSTLYYGKNTTGTWEFEEIGTPGNTRYTHGLVVNTTGIPHIIYMNFNTSHVTYAANTSGTLTYEEIDSGDWYGSDVAITLDTNDNPHVLYTTTTIYPRYLKYAEKKGSTWKDMFVENNGYWSPSIDIALNSSIHMSYGKYSTGSLMYAYGESLAVGSDTIYVSGNNIILSDAGGTGNLILEMDDILNDPDVNATMIWNQTNGNWVINKTISIWENVTLNLGAGNGSGWVKLNTFYVNASSGVECNGTLCVMDGVVTGWVEDSGPYQPNGTVNNTVFNRYRPYIHVYGGGNLTCSNATLGYLGYSNEWEKYGVTVEDSDYSINTTDFIGCYYGLYLFNVSNHHMENVNLSDCGTGLFYRDSDNCSHSNVTIWNMTLDDGKALTQGVHINNSHDLLFDNLTVYDCTDAGVSITGGTRDNFTSLTSYSCGDGMVLDTVAHCSLDGYIHNNSAHGLYISNYSHNISVSSLIFSDNTYNVDISSSCPDNTFSSSTFRYGSYGVLINSSRNTFTSCTARNNAVCGFLLNLSSNNTFTGSSAYNCGDGWNSTGSCFNTIVDGIASGCDRGFVLNDNGAYSHFVNVSNFSVSGASVAGVHVCDHSFNNSFVNVSLTGTGTGYGFRVSDYGQYNTFSDCSATGSYGHGFFVEDYSVHNDFLNCSSNGSTGFSGFFVDDYSNTNSFMDCYGCNNSAYGFVMDRYAHSNTLERCVFSGNGLHGIYLLGSSGESSFGNVTCGSNSGYGIACDEAAHDNDFFYCDNLGNGVNNWYMGDSVDAVSFQSDYVLAGGSGVFRSTSPYGVYTHRGSSPLLNASDVNMIVRPLSGGDTCTVSMGTCTGTSLREVLVSSTGSTSVYFIVGDLAYNATYTVSVKIGSSWNKLEELVAQPDTVRNVTPCINFTWSGPWSSYWFKIWQVTEGEPWSPPTGGYPDDPGGDDDGTGDDGTGDGVPPGPEPPAEDSPETRIPEVKPPIKPDVFYTFEDGYTFLNTVSLGSVTGDVTVVVIDTGVTPIVYERYGLNLAHVCQEAMPMYGSGVDDNGHGTWCCAAVSFVGKDQCPGLEVISLKALDSEGEMSTNLFLDALEMARGLGADIISVSAGAEGRIGGIVDEKVRELARDGIIVVASVGNNGPYPWTVTTPALSPSVLAVGSVNPGENLLDRGDDVVSSWSSRGPVPDLDEIKPDVVALGESIMGPWLDDEKVVSGTSMATPFVAGSTAVVYAKNSGLISVVKGMWFYWKGIVPWIFEKSIEDSCSASVVDYNTGEGVPDFVDVDGSVSMYLLLFCIINPLTLVIIGGIIGGSVWYIKKGKKGKKGKKKNIFF